MPGRGNPNRRAYHRPHRSGARAPRARPRRRAPSCVPQHGSPGEPLGAPPADSLDDSPGVPPDAARPPHRDRCVHADAPPGPPRPRWRSGSPWRRRDWRRRSSRDRPGQHRPCRRPSRSARRGGPRPSGRGDASRCRRTARPPSTDRRPVRGSAGRSAPRWRRGSACPRGRPAYRPCRSGPRGRCGRSGGRNPRGDAARRS